MLQHRLSQLVRKSGPARNASLAIGYDAYANVHWNDKHELEYEGLNCALKFVTHAIVSVCVCVCGAQRDRPDNQYQGSALLKHRALIVLTDSKFWRLSRRMLLVPSLRLTTTGL